MEAPVGAHRLALIIPTCGRPQDLGACLRSIEAEAGDELVQVIVVDDAPWAPAAVGGGVGRGIAAAEVCVVRNQEAVGAAASRNKALAMLRPDVDVVGLLDDDVRLTPRWFEVAMTELKPERGGITGPVQRFDSGLVARARQLRYDARYRPLRPRQPVGFLAGGNAVIWRSTLTQAGDFPAAVVMSDTLLARRMAQFGRPCYFVPELTVLHRNSKGARQACVAAWQAGLVEGRRQAMPYGRRLASGLRAVPTSSDPPAAVLNVALDTVFLTGHATSRASWFSRQVRSDLPSVPPSIDPGPISEVRERA
jgi:GT2 family glycosyltransferase